MPGVATGLMPNKSRNTGLSKIKAKLWFSKAQSSSAMRPEPTRLWEGLDPNAAMDVPLSKERMNRRNFGKGNT